MRKVLLLAFVLWGSIVSAQTDYKIGPQDVLTIAVFGEPDLSGKFTVEQDGTFTYPQIGRIKAAGNTLRGVEQEITKQLRDGFLKNPQVSVSIETYRSQRIIVLGEVRSPGEYQLTSDTTLLSALVRAGSTTPTAGHEVLVVRARKDAGASTSGEDSSEVMHINLQELQAGNLALNVQLQDGDTINVPKAQSVFVSGQVKAPGAYAVDPGTTVLQVLSLAGGLTDRGSDSRIRIQRIVDGKQTEINAKLADIVQPGDTIIVRERFF
jgi:polysaccharide export outer membrane protein